MKVIVLIATLVLATGAFADPEPGRTDGSEGSEYGKGGYWKNAQYGRFYVEGFMGSATVDFEADKLGSVNSSRTDILAGLNAGYIVEDWLGFQLGYGHISDQDVNLYSGGIRSAYSTEPFNYYFSLHAELYAPSVGKNHFGIVPGVGAEVILHKKMRVGLRFHRDFIFGDETIKINKFSAKIRVDY